MRPTALLFSDVPPSTASSSSSSSSARSGSPPASLLDEPAPTNEATGAALAPPPEWEEALLAAELARADERHWEGKETQIHHLPEDLGMGIYSCAKCLIPLVTSASGCDSHDVWG